jgi:hypothetical protein
MTMNIDKKLILSLFRDMYLADHMGDGWNYLLVFAEKIGIELPMDELQCEVDFDALEKMGARCCRDFPTPTPDEGSDG